MPHPLMRTPLHPSMGTAILRHLRPYGDLPASGIVAGQAVCSALLDLYGKGGGVYNDVDVFYDSNRWQPSTPSVVSTIGYYTVGENVDYGHLTGRGVLRVMRSYRRGAINLVACRPAVPVLTAHAVLGTFDINATQVGIDLETGLLSWSRAFERFLHGRELEATTAFTPWHTLLRLLKKRAELPGCHLDLRFNADALIACNPHAVVFGEKYAALYRQFSGEMASFAHLAPRPDTPSLYSIQARGEPDAALRSILASVDVCVVRPFGPALLRRARLRASARSRVLMPQVRDWYSNDFTCVLQAGTQIHQHQFASGQADRGVARKVQTYLNSHPGAFSAFAGLPLADQGRAVDFIRGRAAVTPLPVHTVVSGWASAEDLRSEQALATFLEGMAVHLNKPLARRLDLAPTTVDGVSVRELPTLLALLEEGHAMRHCLREPNHLPHDPAVSLQSGPHHEQWSTATLDVFEGRYKVLSHQGWCNRAPPPSHVRALNRLVRRLRQRYYVRRPHALLGVVVRRAQAAAAPEFYRVRRYLAALLRGRRPDRLQELMSDEIPF